MFSVYVTFLFSICSFLQSLNNSANCYQAEEGPNLLFISYILIMYHVFSSRELLRSEMRARELYNFFLYLNVASKYWNIYGLFLDEERIIFISLFPFLTGYKNGNQKWFRDEKFSHLICLYRRFLDPAWT